MMSRETSRGIASVAMTCEVFGISRQAYYAARKRNLKPPGSKRKSTQRDRPGPWATTDELRKAIHEVVREHVAWGVRKVWATLKRQGLRAGQKRVWSIMKADGLTLEPVALRESPGRYGHVSVPESNRRWATDLTTVWTRQDGVVAVMPVIDCGDRVLLSCEVSKSQESSVVLAPVEHALFEKFGSVEHMPRDLELRTDHGPQYTGADCFDLCKDWNVDHTFAPVGRPTGNAVAERVIGTMKIELIWTRDWDSLEELQVAVEEWLEVYNGSRPHQALGWLTPDEKRAENLGLQLDAAA